MYDQVFVFDGIKMPELLAQAMDLALYGMGTVFTFLTALVFFTSLMSHLVNRFSAPEQIPAAPVQVRSESISPTLLAAVTAAVKQHRSHKE